MGSEKVIDTGDGYELVEMAKGDMPAHLRDIVKLDVVKVLRLAPGTRMASIPRGVLASAQIFDLRPMENPMGSETKHSPLPWSYDESLNTIFDANGDRLPDLTAVDCRLIVDAVNRMHYVGSETKTPVRKRQTSTGYIIEAVNCQIVRFRRMPHAGDLPLPAYASDGAAGMDLLAAIEGGTIIKPGSVLLVATGFAIELPSGYEAQVRPRSGLALKHGVTVLNAPGTIDADYRGEICVILINHGPEPFAIMHGDRIAQLVIAPVVRAAVVEADALGDTARGSGGFGSTGV